MTRGDELQDVARRGKRLQSLHFEARLLTTDCGRSRIGFVVPKHGQAAVRRNQLKRRLRESVRLGLLPALNERSGAPPLDIVIRVRRSAYAASASTLREEFDKMALSIVRFGTSRS